MVKITGCELSKIKNNSIASMKNDFWGYAKEVDLEDHEPLETFKFTRDKNYRFKDKSHFLH